MIVVKDNNGNIHQVTDGTNTITSGLTVRSVTETYISEDKLTWYTKYSDGWKECGGTTSQFNLSAGAGKTFTITLPLEFTNVTYSCQVTASYQQNTNNAGGGPEVFNASKTTTTVLVGLWNRNGSTSCNNIAIEWMCCGY